MRMAGLFRLVPAATKTLFRLKMLPNVRCQKCAIEE
jgi:hypothetical protein